jgi:hypothetical protein
MLRDNLERRRTLNRVVGTFVEKDRVQAPTFTLRAIAMARGQDASPDGEHRLSIVISAVRKIGIAASRCDITTGHRCLSPYRGM